MAYNTQPQGLVSHAQARPVSAQGLVNVVRTKSSPLPYLVSDTNDYPVFTPYPAKNVSGTIYVPGGTTAPAGVVVKLVRQSDDKVVQVTTTNALGQYFFGRDATDPNTYYVMAYNTATPQQHGLGDRGVVPA